MVGISIFSFSFTELGVLTDFLTSPSAGRRESRVESVSGSSLTPLGVLGGLAGSDCCRLDLQICLIFLREVSREKSKLSMLRDNLCSSK